ncbi:hypothetical protein ACFQU9_15975 [Actinomadura namibiensis]|uniref:Uncharacterized protein n=1 Tax=Actinomadura namibiensis TaxID=182080 RepID=A0A7W3LS53_ACTNM|nr:hypothetical protein [Actinomadura namibiensis]MBA8953356.1 hypothetical protein [Actinomadura namibiensis]
MPVRQITTDLGVRPSLADDRPARNGAIQPSPHTAHPDTRDRVPALT